MSREYMDLLRPWLCALPVTDLAPINLNSLRPDQAPLLAMLAPGQLDLDRARAIIVERPSGGWRKKQARSTCKSREYGTSWKI